MFSERTLIMKIPDEVFASGMFTDSRGTTIPYRYYLPEGYETAGKRYPLFLYLHGNGSRGSDNAAQITTYGATFNAAVLNSGHDCIMLAPQCPAHPNEWIDRLAYPGSDAFADDLADGKLERIHLNAAIELLSSFIQNEAYRVDTSRIYVAGPSNGGAATWALTAAYPHVFAAAIPMCGAGQAMSPMTKAGVDALVPRWLHTPIWAFHGDADKMLSIEGTKTLVNAIKAAGGDKIRFTVIPGGPHNIVTTVAATDGLTDWLFAQKNDNFVNTLPTPTLC